MEKDAFPCLIAHKRPVHEGAIHLEEASKELARNCRHVQNPLFEDEQGVITMQDKVFETSRFIVHDNHPLRRILIENREVEVLHKSFDSIKLYHTFPLDVSGAVVGPRLGCPIGWCCKRGYT
jgi:hypothetical protein